VGEKPYDAEKPFAKPYGSVKTLARKVIACPEVAQKTG
jgi:hypothetical protein